MVGEDFLKGEQDCLDNQGRQRKRIPGRGYHGDESTKDLKETGHWETKTVVVFHETEGSSVRVWGCRGRQMEMGRRGT